MKYRPEFPRRFDSIEHARSFLPRPFDRSFATSSDEEREARYDEGYVHS
jgi:hypothetical protein